MVFCGELVVEVRFDSTGSHIRKWLNTSQVVPLDIQASNDLRQAILKPGQKVVILVEDAGNSEIQVEFKESSG